MSRAEDGVIGKREYLLAICAQGILVGDDSAAHGTREQRVSRYRELPWQSGNDIRDAAGGMPARKAALDGQHAGFETMSRLERLRSTETLTAACESRRTRFLNQAIRSKM